MKIYNCDVCNQLVYFENSLCVNCNSQLGYLPIVDNMSSLESVGENQWKALAPSANGNIYKKCQNYHWNNVCNWMIPVHDFHDYCISCRLNDIIPDLSIPENKIYWHRLEIAKRRLVYSLLRLGLPLRSKVEDPHRGLAFDFLGNNQRFQLKESKRVLTGHNQGKITLNIAEANDAIREKMRLDMHERYRTLLGHFRHEIGHYYWFLIVGENDSLLSECREVFGDENVSYAQALKRHYAEGPHPQWQQHYISSYASSHPWEDFAESWAHYLHMFDAIETARSWGLSIRFVKGNEQTEINLREQLRAQTFEEMKDQWLHLSSALNSLNRSMGLKDVYPFVWSDSILKKLRFIQKVIFNNPQDVHGWQNSSNSY